MIPIKINDEVTDLRHPGRHVVVSLEGSFAILQLFAEDKQTMERRYLLNLTRVLVQDLTLLGKNHTRPEKFQLIR